MVKIVLGLGNPGRHYARSRHNAGFHVVARLAERAAIALSRERFGVIYGEGAVAGQAVLLGLPQTYMNLSGEAAGLLLRYRAVEPAEALAVVHDDLDLSCGRLKVKYGGGHGGHNGLRSLVAHLGTEEFTRIRVGVGRPPGPGQQVVDHVLGRPTPDETALLEASYDRAIEAVLVWMQDGPEIAMNRFNRPGQKPAPGGGEKIGEEDKG